MTTPCYDGTGQSIAIMGQTDLSIDSNHNNQYDVVTFRNLAGLPTGNLQIVVNGTDPGLQTSDVDEANLDVEWSGATAPSAKLIYVITSGLNNGAGAFGSLIYAVNNNLAPVISISYGVCETQAAQSDLTNLTNAGVQANAQGQAIVAPSGDSGAADCDANLPATVGLSVDFPASMPYATGVGGTTFTGDTANSTNPTQPTQYWAGSTNDIVPSAFSYIPETSWNDTNGLSTGTISATGGGASTKFTKPSWQTGPGVPADGARDVPDIAFAASPSPDGYLICSQSSCVNGYRQANTDFSVIGGTSAGTPSFAGILAVYNQVKGSPQGNINSHLYSIVSSYPLPGDSNTSWAYNDITSGNNIVSCTGGTGCSGGSLGYSAGPGYDRVTGLGSLDATALIDALNNTPNPHFLVLPASRSIALAANSTGTIAVAVTPKEGFTNTVTLTCTSSSSLTGVTCSYDNSSINTSGIANLTITSGSQTQLSGTVTVTGTSGGITNSAVINVSVGVQDFTVTSTNATETVSQGSSTTDTITITPVQGFTGTVSFTSTPCTGTTGLTCSLNPTSVTINSASAVTSTLTVTASGTASSGSITITTTSGAITHNHPISVTVNAVSPNFTMTVASPVVSIPSGGSITDNVTVAALGSFSSDVALTCSVPSSLKTTTCSISPSTVAGGNGTAAITLQGATLSKDFRPAFPFGPRGMESYASLVFALGAVFTANQTRRRKTRRVLRNILFGLFLLIVMFGAVSCGSSGGGGGGGTTPINGTVTITGTGGGVTNTVTINVTVS